MTIMLIILGVGLFAVVAVAVFFMTGRNDIVDTSLVSRSAPPVAPVNVSHVPVVAGNEDLVSMARDGQLIEAIKLYRERTGVGLKEAKDAVEALRDGNAVAQSAPSATPSGAWLEQVQALVDEDKLIDAIKLYRENSNLGLKESMEAVKAMKKR